MNKKLIIIYIAARKLAKYLFLLEITFPPPPLVKRSLSKKRLIGNCTDINTKKNTVEWRMPPVSYENSRQSALSELKKYVYENGKRAFCEVDMSPMCKQPKFRKNLDWWMPPVS